MTQEHQITPPEEVIDEWEGEWHHYKGKDTYDVFMATQAARWGADQELEACCVWLRASLPGYDKHYADCLRAARRPKPPSLKEQALAALNEMEDKMFGPTVGEKLIRRALEALPDEQ